MKLKKCISCGIYTVATKCPKCGKETKSAHPMKYSFQDKYAEYRRKEKFAQLLTN